MEQLKLFPAETVQSSKVLFANFGEKEVMYCLGLLPKLHEMGVSAEIYPDAAKLKKQFSYADSRHIQYVVLAGENEIAEGILAVKNMTTGEQFKATVEELVKMLG
jgi:histidyl-tRNA synthetase